VSQLVLDTDSFNGTNGTQLPSYNANWNNQPDFNNVIIAGTPGVGGNLAANFRSGFTWTADQWAQLTIDGTTVPSTAIGVTLRMNTGGISSGYFGGFNNNAFGDNLYRFGYYDTAVLHHLALAGAGTTAAAGDVVNFQVVGNILTLTVNGVVLGTYDFTSDGLSYSGDPGLVIEHSSAATRTAGSWSAGKIQNASSFPLSGPFMRLLGGNQ
jgi:hypothetical protein